MTEEITAYTYRVYWKNWKGEWVSNEKTYKTEKAAKRFAKTIAKQAENGVYTIQKF
jgi:hypothetical protein